MNDNTATENRSTDLEPRSRRALEQFLTVLPEAPDLYTVVSQSGESYTVDAREGACTCPDFQYRNVRCKHLRRVAFATGERPIPPDVDAVGVDPDELLGAHVDGDGPRRVAADGGELVQ